MSVAPAAQPPAKRRIGDILLDLGFASEEALADASAEQEQTGQPLGQILVARGVITRLELASALAEQWSDQSASISLLPVPQPGPRPAPQQHQEDDQYAARLQEAVADLAQRVHDTKPDGSVTERVTDLAERVEATVARSQRLEATIATLAESLEGVTGGVEDAFGALQTGMAGLALDLARIDTTVAELVAAPAEGAAPDPVLVEQIESLSSAVQELAARPVADPAIQDRVADLATRLDGAADNQALTDLQAALAGIEERLGVLAEDDRADAEIATQATMLTELRSALTELQERPASDPDLDAHLERLETRLADRLATVADATEVQRLGARVEATAVLQEQIAETIAALGQRLEELATAGGNDDSAERLDAVAGEIQALAATLEGVRQSIAAEAELAVSAPLDELRTSLGTIRDDLASLAQAATTEQLEELRARVEQLAAVPDPTAALATKLDDVEARLASGLVTPQELERAIAEARAELTTAPAGPDERVDRITDELNALAARLEQLDATPTPDERVDQIAEELQALEAKLARLDTNPSSAEPLGPELAALAERVEQLAALAERVEQLAVTPVSDEALAAKLDELESRLASGLVTPEELERAIAEARAEPAAAPQPDERIDRLSGELHDLAARLAQLDTTTAPDASLATEIEALSERVEQLAAAPDPTPALVAKLDELEARLTTEPATTTAPDPGVASALDTLAAKLDAVEARLGDDVATAATVEQAVNEVRAELAAIPTPQPADTTGLEESLAQLTERLAGLEAVAGRVEELAEAVAVTSSARSAATPPSDDLREELEQKLADVTRMVEERLAGATVAPTAGAGAGEPEGFEAEMERTRMAIERLGSHLSGHDRAIKELMASRGSGGGGRGEPTYGQGAAEAASDMRTLIRRLENSEDDARLDREKLMSRLERMATSMDWRLQRLEAAGSGEQPADEPH